MKNNVIICNSDSNKTTDQENNISTVFLQSTTIIGIPLFQRRYKWEKNLISLFINDLNDHFLKENSGNYFLGTFVTMENIDGTNRKKSIVDGQQRLTTLTLAKTIFEICNANNINDFKFEMLYRNKDNLISRWVDGETPEPIKNLMLIISSSMTKFFEDEIDFSDLVKKMKEEISKDDILKIFLEEFTTVGAIEKFKRVWSTEFESKIIFANVRGDESSIGRIYENINFKLMPLTSFELFKNKLFLKNITLGGVVSDIEINKLVKKLIDTSDLIWKASKTKKSSSKTEEVLRVLLMSITSEYIPPTDSQNIGDFYKKLNSIEDKWCKTKDDFKNYIKSLYANLEKMEIISNMAIERTGELYFLLNTLIRSTYVVILNLIPLLNEENTFELREVKHFFKWMLIEVVKKEKRLSGDNQFDSQLKILTQPNGYNKNFIISDFINDEFKNAFVNNDWYSGKGYFDRAVLLLNDNSKKMPGAISFKAMTEVVTHPNNFQVEHIHPKKADMSKKAKYPNFDSIEPKKNKIGNLVILEKWENKLASNSHFSEKKNFYDSSSFGAKNIKKWNDDIFEDRAKDILKTTIEYLESK